MANRAVHDISDSDDDIEIVYVKRAKKENFSQTQQGSSKASSVASNSSIKNGLEKNVEHLRKKSCTPSLSKEINTSLIQANCDEVTGNLPQCDYGFLCYRSSEDHAKKFCHPSRAIGFYLTKCDDVVEKFNSDTFTRSLKQILHEDIGDTLESAVHFSYVYDMEWLLDQYPERYRQLPMLLVVQQSDELLKLLIAQRQIYRNVFLLPIEMARFGTHHTKMISLKYKNSLRIVVTTANLYETDWRQKTQMIWVSPILKKLGDKKGPDSKTGFRSALCSYLRSYQKRKLLDLADSLADYDFSPIKCYFIASTPNSINSGLTSLESVLSKKIPSIPKDYPVSFCFSSIGTLGQDDAAWLRSSFGRTVLLTEEAKKLALNDITPENIKAIYPTIDEVRKSYEGYEAGRSLPYSGKVHMKQRWLANWLHHWKSDSSGRSRASPHIKFYIRTSADYKQTFWFLMTSANLSKAAWGNLRTKAPLSYEAGVLYVPENHLETKQIITPFDLPPIRYGMGDKLWTQDNVYSELDDFGNLWDPREGGTVSRM